MTDDPQVSAAAKIHTAILGYGRSGGSMHAGAIQDNADAYEMVAVCDIDGERQKQAAERFGCPIYDDYHKMLAEEQLDLVSVVTRSDQHCQMTCDCLAAGVNVLVTKPWAVDVAQAQRMCDAAKAPGQMLLPWLPARWDPTLGRLRQLVAEDTIGKVFLIRRAVTSFATRCDWQTESRYGGGYLLNWGPHIVDTAVLLGGAPVRSVYGRLKQMINPGDVEDVFLAVMTLTNDTVVQAEYTLALEDLPNWYVQGDRGTIVVRGDQMKVYKNTPAQPDDPTQFGTMKSDDEETFEETITGRPHGDPCQVYAEAAQALRGARPFPVTPEHALELSRTLDAIRAAAQQDRIITLNEPAG